MLANIIDIIYVCSNGYQTIDLNVKDDISLGSQINSLRQIFSHTRFNRSYLVGENTWRL